jgi:hypothetical protein
MTFNDPVPLPTDEQIMRRQRTCAFYTHRPMFEILAEGIWWHGAARWDPEKGWGGRGYDDGSD